MCSLLFVYIYSTLPYSLFRWEKEEWEESRKDFMDSLGHRAQAWESGANASFTSPSATSAGRGGKGGGDIFSTTEMSSLAILPASSVVQPLGSSWFGSGGQVQTPKQTFTFGGSTPATGGGSTLRSPSQQREICERAEAQQLPLLREHARATRILHMIDQSETRDPYISLNQIQTPCRDLLASLPYSASECFAAFDLRSENDLKGYQFLLSLIAEMTGEGQPPPGRNKPGYFSPVVADHQQHAPSSSRELHERREMLSTGAREHLENDFRHNVIQPESDACLGHVRGADGKGFDLMGGLEPSSNSWREGEDDTILLDEVQKYVSAIMPPPQHVQYSYNIECDEDGVLFWPQVCWILFVLVNLQLLIICSSLFSAKITSNFNARLATLT